MVSRNRDSLGANTERPTDQSSDTVLGNDDGPPRAAFKSVKTIGTPISGQNPKGPSIRSNGAKIWRRGRQYLSRGKLKAQAAGAPLDPGRRRSTFDPQEGEPAKRGSLQKCPSIKSIMDIIEPKSESNIKYPEFDSLAQHSFPRSAAKQFREAEAKRLSHILDQPDKALQLGKTELLSAMNGDEEGYRKLSKISQCVLTAQNLCLLDNECINVQYCSRLASNSRMQKLIQQAQLVAQPSSFAEGDGGEEDEYDSEGFIHDAFQLIDYVSALLMRLIHQTAVGEYWLTNVMAVLVARVAKIKALLTDVKLGANESIAVGTDHLKDAQTSSRSSHSFSININADEEECEEALRIIDADTKEGLTSEEDAKISAYCVTQNKFRSGLNSAIKYILSSLLFTNPSGLPVTNYEVCAVVYDIGFEGFKTMLFQDRDLEYSASSDRNVLNTAQSALRIVNQTLQNTKNRVEQHPPQVNGKIPTYFEWAFLEMTDKKAAISASGISYNRLSRSMENVQIFSMADIAEVMIALFVASAILISDFTNFRSMIALSGGVEDVVTSYEEGQFGAFLRLYTREFEQGAKQRETLLLSTAFSQQRFSRCKLLADGNGRWGRANRQLQRVPTLPQIQPTSEHNGEEVVQEKLNYCVIQMEKWVVDETSVTVSCKTYVWSLMAITAVLVGGGLAMGLAVGQRIDGVDPFNLATYTWALAAFIIVVFKSMWVESWTWSDFLRQRVRCRSVSELAAATNLDYQLIMAKLLRDDCNGSILVTRGPYNTIFRNQSNDGGDGFSVDQPLSAETLMLSGIALLKVLTPRGHAVVCLDYRCGTLLTILEHRRGTDSSRLVCEDLSRIPRGRDSADQKAQELISLRLKKVEIFKWKRVQGLWEFQYAGIVFE